MFKKVFSLCIVLTLAVLATVQICAKDEKKITKDQVPKPVMAAFEKAYPKAVVKEYEQKTRGKEVFYAIEFVDGTVTREIKYKADGTVVGMEEQIAVKDLPEAVTKAIASKYAGATIKSAEKETRDGVTTYEVTLDVKGKEQEVKFSDKGEVIPKKEHKG